MGVARERQLDMSPLNSALSWEMDDSDDEDSSSSERLQQLQSSVKIVQQNGREFTTRVYLYPGLRDVYNGELHAAVRSGQLDLVSSLLDLGAKVKDTDAEGRVPLHIAAKNGRRDLAAKLLERHTGVDVDIQDKEGKTPLYYAVAEAYPDVVTLLLERGANTNIVAKPRHTMLSLILGGEGYQGIATQLLKYGASPIFAVDQRVLDLISAAASGKWKIVLKLLTEGVDVNGQDGFGYSALYEAARFGHEEIVKLLIAAGATPNSRTGLSGDTALHGIVDKGYKCQLLLQSFASDLGTRASAPTLSSTHVNIARILLQYGTLSEARRWDGLTINGMISKALADQPIAGDQGISLNAEERGYMQELRELIESPPGIKHPRKFQSRLPSKWCPLPQRQLNEDELEVCKYFKVRVHHHYADYFKARLLTVDQFIYNRNYEMTKEWARLDEEEYIETLDTPEEKEAHRSKGANKSWKWIHLPANNKRWVKDLIRVMFREEGCNSSKIRDIEAFIDETYQEFRGSASYARYRKPSFDENKDGGTRISSLVAPYFDMETEAFLDRRDKCEDGHMKMMQRLVEAYQHGGTSVEELHMACTLDQSYYTSLSDSNDRDRDQVVFRFHSRGQDAAPQRDKGLDTANDGTKEPYNVPIKRARARRKGKSMGKLAMVSQLWLWKIDEDIIITAFPERWHGGYEKDILGHILGNLYDSPPSSFDQMVGSILQSCVGFVDAPSNAGLDENLFNIFEESIARVANNETIRYQKFCKHQQVCAEVNQKIRKGEKMSSEEIKAFRSTEDKICDITEEVKHLEEIKDIRDELRMVGRVLEDQKTVLRKYQADKTDRLGPDVLLKLELRERKAKMLGAEAESVENSLRNLLDLKQKQGNLNEARDTKKLADEAEKRALADKTQSKLLSVFTFVTVIYTPLAFISALFAIPSSDYPGGNNGNGATWRWWQILAGSLVAEIFTSLLIFAYWWGIHKKDGIKSKRSGRSRLISDLPRAITWETDEGSTEKSAHVELVGVKVDE